MKSEKYSNEKNYNGKWCLFKNASVHDYYTSIFVIEKADDIVKFVYEGNTSVVNYVDSEFFENQLFFINPIQIAKPIINSDLKTNSEVQYTKPFDSSIFTEYGIKCNAPGYMEHSLNQ